MNSGVKLLSFTSPFTSAPFSNKYFTIFSYPLQQALNNGVLSSFVFLFISAPCSTKYFTIFSCPLQQAPNNGVIPSLSSLFTFNPHSQNILLNVHDHYNKH